MDFKPRGFLSGSQTGAASAPVPGTRARTTAPSAAPAGKGLLSFAEVGADVLGVSERKAHDVIKQLGVVPVVLGPRCVRIVRAELEAALANLPRRVEVAEPACLLRGKVERLKRGAAAWTADANTAAQTKQAEKAGTC
jgi:hypothetical protein